MENFENLANLPLNLSFDIPSLIAGLLFGIVGYWMYKQGRKKINRTVTLTEVGLMIYPYFVDGAFLNWLIGFLLCGVAYHFWNSHDA